jgi:hypothetical protein
MLAALRAGVTTVMLPARNRRDFEKSRPRREKLEFVWLERVDEAVATALSPDAAENITYKRLARSQPPRLAVCVTAIYCCTWPRCFWAVSRVVRAITAPLGILCVIRPVYAKLQRSAIPQRLEKSRADYRHVPVVQDASSSPWFTWILSILARFISQYCVK